MEARRRGRTAGTRGGIGRVAAMAVALVLLAALVLADAARAGTYEVAQCGWGVDAELDEASAVESLGAGTITDRCTAPGLPQALAGLLLDAASMTRIGDGLIARWPAAPGTAFVAVRGVWSGAVMPSFRQELGYGEGAKFRPVAATYGMMYPTAIGARFAVPADSLVFRLRCIAWELVNCLPPPSSHALLREVVITVADAGAPQARVTGPLAAPGWHRGAVALELDGEDAGAGVDRLQATVGGASVALLAQPCATAVIEGARRATALRPCARAAASTVAVDTARLPDGTDLLRGCAVDFAGNVGCAAEVPIRVDNSAPSIDLAAGGGQVTATVFDPFSGPASGAIAMRRGGSDAWVPLPTALRRDGPGKATLVASLPALQEGAYVFRAAAVDAAGNSASATTRIAEAAPPGAGVGAGEAGKDGADSGGGDEDTAAGAADRSGPGHAGSEGKRHPGPARQGGAPAPRGGRGTRLLVQLGGGRGRRGPRSTVAFGAAATLRGRLTTADGEGVARRMVKITARATRGAIRVNAVHRVTTDRHGRFALRLAPGPSRRLLVAFPGGEGLAPSRSRTLALRVHAAVSLSARPPALRTGQTVRLRGRVAHRGARIPRRGKLVAIQYLERDSGRWRPALVIRSGRGGRFHARYRFRYVSGAARIRLRATALPEAGWPYAAGSSAPVTVRVHGG